MSDERQETIADIVAEMRIGDLCAEDTSASRPEFINDFLASYADRIEAAAKREREAGAEAAQLCGEIGEIVGREATTEKSSAVANAMKMREALLMILGTVDHLQTRFDIPKLTSEEILGLKQIAESALSATPRNCDRFATLDDARNAFFADYVPDETCSSANAFAIWLFDEAKGETDVRVAKGSTK